MKKLLNSISKNQNLWKIAESNAVKCIENYISESIELDFPLLQKVTISDFIISKDSQSLISSNNGDQNYILRTSLKISLQNDIQNISGYYFFDVNETGKFIDEWFVIQ
nr:hypothetical protein [uncultured Flavobacterium sp.]